MGYRSAEVMIVSRHAEEIKEQGYTLIPETLTREQIRDATSAMLEVYEREREIAEGVETQTEHALAVHHLFAKHRYFEEFYLNDKVNATLQLVLGDNMVLSESHDWSQFPAPAPR